jgi:hypothetical protein
MRAARRRPNLPLVAVNTRSIFYRIFYRTVRHEGLLEGTQCQRRYAKLQVTGTFHYQTPPPDTASMQLRIRRLGVRIPPSALDVGSVGLTIATRLRTDQRLRSRPISLHRSTMAPTTDTLLDFVGRVLAGLPLLEGTS